MGKQTARERAEHALQHGWPASPADEARLRKWLEGEAQAIPSNEEWGAAEDDATDADLAQLEQLISEGRYDECRPILKRLGNRYTVPARPPRSQRPRCGAMTRRGTPCQAPVVWRKGDPLPRERCRMHGGLSTGPRSDEGKQAIAESNRRRAAAKRTPWKGNEIPAKRTPMDE